MRNKLRIMLIISSLAYNSAPCQKADPGALAINLPSTLPTIIVNGDTTPVANLDEVTVIGNRVFKSFD